MERQVKERLIGAAVLVAAAVVLIPELLSGPKRPATAPTARAGEAPIKTYTIDLNHSPDAKVTEEAAPPPEVVTPEPSGSTGTSSSDSVAGSSAVSGNDSLAASEAEEVSPADAIPEPAPAAATSTKRAETNPESASSKPATKPAASPRPAIVEEKQRPVPVPPKPAIPQPVAPQPAAKPLASAPAAPSSASKDKPWAVQLGSFASKANAERLVKEWEGRGERGSVTAVKAASGTLYRVRLGPFADRAKADEVLRKVKPSIAGAAVVAQQ